MIVRGEDRMDFSINGAETLDFPMGKKNEIRPLPHIVQKKSVPGGLKTKCEMHAAL